MKVIQNWKMISLFFFILEVNRYLSLWASDAENYMYDMDEEYTFLKDLMGSMDVDIIKRDKIKARFLVIKNMCMASKIKQEHALESPGQLKYPNM